MKFFSNKLTWLIDRYDEITEEMRRRGIQVTYPVPKVPLDIPLVWFGGWAPTDRDKELSRERISERIANSQKTYHYNHVPV
jgi:hypothetical protein